MGRMPRLIPPVVEAGSMAESVQPELTSTAGLLLRPWHHDDAAAALLAFADPEIQRWHFQRIDDLDEARTWIESTHAGWKAESSANWAIIEAGAEEPAGRVGLTKVDLAAGWGEISYWVLPTARGRGLASRAVSALASWAFDGLGLHRIDIEHSVENAASCRVATRAGFTAEATLGSALLHEDGWHDVHLHAKVRPAS